MAFVAAASAKDFDVYKLYVGLLAALAIAFCQHLLYVEFWHWTAMNTDRLAEPLHWALIKGRFDTTITTLVI